MQQAKSQQPHAERFVQIKMVDAKKFDAVLGFGKQAMFNADSLRGDLVVRAERGEPIENVGNSQRNDDDPPLPCAVNNRGPSAKQDFFDDRFMLGGECSEIGIAESAFDRRGFDCLSADRANFCIVAHVGLST